MLSYRRVATFAAVLFAAFAPAALLSNVLVFQRLSTMSNPDRGIANGIALVVFLVAAAYLLLTSRSRLDMRFALSRGLALLAIALLFQVALGPFAGDVPVVGVSLGLSVLAYATGVLAVIDLIPHFHPVERGRGVALAGVVLGLSVALWNGVGAAASPEAATLAALVVVGAVYFFLEERWQLGVRPRYPRVHFVERSLAGHVGTLAFFVLLFFGLGIGYAVNFHVGLLPGLRELSPASRAVGGVVFALVSMAYALVFDRLGRRTLFFLAPVAVGMYVIAQAPGALALPLVITYLEPLMMALVPFAAVYVYELMASRGSQAPVMMVVGLFLFIGIGSMLVQSLRNPFYNILLAAALLFLAVPLALTMPESKPALVEEDAMREYVQLAKRVGGGVP